MSQSLATNQPRSVPLPPDSLLSAHRLLDNPAGDSLKSAFDLFNELSLQLADSYQQLEQRVADLTDELDDVSEQRYQELHAKEQLAHRLETLINCLPGGVVVLDNRGQVVDSNPAAESLLGGSLQQQRWRDIIKTCFMPREDDGHEVSTRDGKRISITTRSLGGDGQIILLTDQTETRRLQAQQSRDERLFALGKMVSTLAHQVRTPLSSAMLYANHLRNDNLPTDKRQNFTGKLLNRLHYMERQVRDMLLFVKGDIPLTDKVTPEQLRQLWAEAIEMPLASYGASCQWQVTAESCQLPCNLDGLLGALLNLVNNSLQAVPQVQLLLTMVSVDEQLIIRVEDNGPGLRASDAQLQEMFFTTKDQGTGIGLSVVRIVAQAHRGEFTLTNRPQGGCCAQLRLPLITHY